MFIRIKQEAPVGNDGFAVSPYGIGTSITDDKGNPINGVMRLGIEEFGADDLIVANLRIGIAEFDIPAEAKFSIVDPISGKTREVASITYTDGETVEF